jgi:hypothetical protein
MKESEIVEGRCYLSTYGKVRRVSRIVDRGGRRFVVFTSYSPGEPAPLSPLFGGSWSGELEVELAKFAENSTQEA